MHRDKEVEKITKSHAEQQNQLLRFFSRVDIESKLKIMQTQKEIFFRLKNIHNDVDNVVLSYSSLIISILSERKDKNINTKIFKAKKFRKNFKREKILEKWAIIRSLKLDEKLSFRQISRYLKKYHKLDISYSLLYKTWIDLEEKIIKEGDQNNG